MILHTQMTLLILKYFMIFQKSFQQSVPSTTHAQNL
jgi:hypothetical protein